MSVPVFFDVDNTLLESNTARLFSLYLYRQGLVTKGDLIKNGWLLLKYKLALFDYEKVLVTALELAKNRNEQCVSKYCEAWYKKQARKFISPKILKCVREHQAKGHRLALLTASNKYMVEPLAQELDIDTLICTRLEIQDGRFTGRAIQPVCFGEGKLFWARRWCEREGLRLGDGYFYTDSYTDLPVLERVAEPRIVNPDVRLRRYAKRHRLPVMTHGS